MVFINLSQSQHCVLKKKHNRLVLRRTRVKTVLLEKYMKDKLLFQR